MPKLRLETTNPVSLTLLIPLWARAVEQQQLDPIVSDPIAPEMVAKIDYDWRKIRMSRGDLALMVVRLREFDRFVRDFLGRHPDGTVVQLGCGLDARFQRVDNGRVRWFDLDLGDVIALRRRLLPESERNRYLAASVTEQSWMDEVAASGTEPMLFVAEAVLPYLEERHVKGLFLELQRRFPGSGLVTDVCTRFAVHTDNLQLLAAGSSARMHWALRYPRDPELWGPGIRLVESFSYFDAPHPRMGIPAWFGRLPLISKSSTIQRYGLGGSAG